MNKLQGYLFATALLLTVGYIATSCNKEELEPQCNCQTIYENLETVNTGGTVQLLWVLDYETTPIEADCSTSSDYSYNGNTTTRWHTECN